jgi:hypothetical protein
MSHASRTLTVTALLIAVLLVLLAFRGAEPSTFALDGRRLSFDDSSDSTSSDYASTAESDPAASPRPQSPRQQSETAGPRHIIPTPAAATPTIPVTATDKQSSELEGRPVATAIPLMLTHAGYHGPALLKANFPSWVRHLLRPQRDIDLVIFYQRNGISLDAVLPLVGCTNAYGLQMSDVASLASASPSQLSGSIYPAATMD